MGNSRRTFRMTPEDRLATRTGMPVWWPVPTEITLDRATTQLPSLLYQRLDEIGLDFSIVYPGMGLLIMTLPGMADETLRRGSARAFNTLLRRDVPGPRGPHGAGRRDPDAHARGGGRGARVRREHLGAQGRRDGGRRAASQPRLRRRAPRPGRPGPVPGLLRDRQPLRLRPGVAEVPRPRRGAHLPLGAHRLGLPRSRCRATSTTSSAASPRAARRWPSRCSSAA